MKKILKKFILIMTVFSMFMFVLSNNLQILTSEFETMAESYRTTYTIYGDLNNDKKIDSFDVVMMRQKVLSKDTSKELDFNYDGKVDVSDLKLLNDYVLGKISILDIYFYDDADEDGLCDLLEVSLLKTNPDSLDTDGDTLSDFDEVVYTKTSPTDKYTNKLSVTDADDDSDGDKLTNKEELSYKTNSLLSDSDFDGVNDYDEIKKYMTDPNNDDSDNDNIIDGDEIKLGLKPNTDKSNGTTPDNNRTFKQNIAKSNEILSYINADDNPYELSIDIVSAGIAEKELSVSVGEFSNCSEDKNIIGKSVMLDYNDNLSVDSAKIYFSPRKPEGKISDYMIFKFFPENNYLLPVQTKYTDSSAYVETKDLGTYCLVNVKDIFRTDNENLSSYNNTQILSSENVSFSKDIVLDYELGETEVVFLVDISGALDSNLEETKNSIHDFSQALFEHTENGVVSIFGYYANPTTAQTKIIQYNDANQNKIFSSMKSIDEALNEISSYTTSKDNPLISPISLLESLSNNNLFSSTCPNKYAFIVSDSTYSFTNGSGFGLVVPKTTCKSLKNIYNNDICLNFILSEDSFKQTKAINNLQKECQSYNFGIYSKSKTGYFANDMYARIYSDAVIDLMEIPVVYTSSVMPYSIPEKVERNAFINSLPKSVDSSKVPSADADGNIDFKDAVDKIGLKFENLRSACDMFDLTHKGYEQLMSNQDMSVNLIIGAVQVTPFSDKVLYADNDNDGIPNKDDPYPDEPFDDRFEIVNNFDYEPTINFVEERYQNSQNCYSSIPKLDNNDTIIFNILALVAKENDLSFADEIIANIMGNMQATMDFGFNGLRKNEKKAMNHASKALLHYFDNNGEPINYNQSETCELLACSPNYIDHLHRNLTRAMRCSEQLLNDNESVYFSSKDNSGFKSTCNVDRGIDTDGILCDINDDTGTKSYHNNLSKLIMCNYVHRDWWNTVGEAGAAIVAKTTRSGNKYTMTYKYYVKDIYEWAYHYDGEILSQQFHIYHEQGLAQEFLINGQFLGEITWFGGEDAYLKDIPSNVKHQIENTLKNHMENEKWSSCNEYDRFFSYLNR